MQWLFASRMVWLLLWENLQCFIGHQRYGENQLILLWPHNDDKKIVVISFASKDFSWQSNLPLCYEYCMCCGKLSTMHTAEFFCKKLDWKNAKLSFSVIMCWRKKDKMHDECFTIQHIHLAKKINFHASAVWERNNWIL